MTDGGRLYGARGLWDTREPMIGQILGHYRITEKVGEGAMGVVFRAHDERLHRDVAVKVLPGGALVDDDARKRFRREALALSRLNHPNVQSVYDFDTQDGVDFLVVEFVPGVTLAERIAGGALSWSEASQLGAQLVEGLAAAHQQGVVHRDLKPANVRVTPDGRVKLLDFGLAKMSSQVESVAVDNLTRSRTVVGTLMYMAPEQLRGLPADARSDIFALGVVLYEMTTGRHPFDCRVEPAMAYEIINKTPPVPSEIRRDLPIRASTLIMKCMEKDSDRRYQSANEVLAMLRAPDAPETIATNTWARARVVRVGAIGLGAVAIALVFLATKAGWFDGSPARADIESLAVLPLKNLSADPEQDYFADGMTEALITDLGRIAALRVISRTSAMRYKDSTKALPEIGRELSVDALVEGSVLRDGDRVRINAQLIDADTDEQLWSESYERDLRDVLGLQSEVARSIASAIELTLTPVEQALLGERRPIARAAYEEYLKGQYFLHQSSREGFLKSIRHFESAIREDSSYAESYAGIADAYLSLDDGDYMPEAEARTKARQAANQALALDETLANAHLSLGHLAIHEWQWAVADRELRRAIELNPSYAPTYRYWANYLIAFARYDEAIAAAKKGEELDPLWLAMGSTVGFQLLRAGRVDEALAQARKLLDMNPNFRAGHGLLCAIYATRGMYDEAVDEARIQLALDDSSNVTLGMAGFVYGRAGRTDEARAALSLLHDASRRGPVSAINFAAVHIGLGQTDSAFVWLEKAYEERSEWLAHLKVDLMFESLRGDPRLDDLARRIGLPTSTPP